jgi:hypothetical protein
MPRAGSQSLAVGDLTLFSGDADGGNCTAFLVRNRDASTADALVKVTPIHRSAEYLTMPAGTERIFRKRLTGISKVEAKGGGATVDYGVVEE